MNLSKCRLSHIKQGVLKDSEGRLQLKIEITSLPANIAIVYSLYGIHSQDTVTIANK